MKLNKLENIKICEKVLYSFQLVNYSQLCEIYQKLANTMNDTPMGAPNAEAVARRFSKPLAQAVHGNIDTNKFPPNSKEYNLLSEYSFYATNLINARTAADLLNNSIKENDYINSNEVNKYKDFMSEERTLQKLQNDINTLRPESLSYKAYKLTQYSINKINSIDKNHIPIQFSENVTPYMFGKKANINGYVKPASEVSKEAQKSLKTYKSSHRNLIIDKIKKIGTVTLLGGMAVFGGNMLYTNYEHSRHSVQNAEIVEDKIVEDLNGKEYELNISPKTYAKLADLRKDYNMFKEAGVNITSDFRMNLDHVINDVISDLMIDGIQTAHPEWSNISINSTYDYTGSAKTQTTIGNKFSEVKYTNKKGEKKSILLSNGNGKFSKELERAFEDNYKLDTGADFKEIGKILENTENLAALKFNFKDGIFSLDNSKVKVSSPDEIKNDNNDNLEH